MARKVIKGVGVQLDSKDIQNCKSLDDVEKLEIFDHLSKKEQDDANTELWEEIKTNHPEEEGKED